MNTFKPFSLKIFGLIALISILFVQCSPNKTPKPADPAFSGYISAYTGGIISNQSVIKVRLAEAHPDAAAQKTIEEHLFDFSPDVKGQTYWLDEQTIVFKPESRFPSGKLFEVKFYLYKLLKVPAKLETFVFQFQIIKQSLEMKFEGMSAYNEKDLKWQTLNGSLQTYDFVDNESLEKSVHITQNGKDLSVRWEHKDGGKLHKFLIDSIHRTENKGQVILQWNGKQLDFDGKGEEIFPIPPLGEFKVTDIHLSQEKEQFVSIYFSDPINNDQNLEGLVYFQPNVSFRMIREGNSIKLYPNRQINSTLKLIVSPAIRNSLGYQLTEPFEKQITFSSIKPAVELIGKGVILPSTNGLIFPFRAVNLNAVNITVVKIFENNIQQFFQTNQFDGTGEMKRVARLMYKGEFPLKSDNPINYANWNNFSIDLSGLINPEPGAIYRVALSFAQSQSVYPCDENDNSGETVEFKQIINSEDSWDNPTDIWYYSDGDEDYYYNPDYKFNERNNPCKASYFIDNSRVVARNILASDFGIIAKGGTGNKMVVAVTDLKSTKPIPELTIELYNFQQQLISTSQTNSEGIVVIDLNKKPYLLIAKKDKQRGYLRLDDGSALSLSMFDISGQKSPDGVKGFIYGERGVWRPGDSLFISFILEDKNKVLPENHPVIFELYTPQQQLFERKVRTTSLNQFYDFRTATPADAPTGNWTAYVKLGGSVFSKTLKIETVKPNRLKINLDFKAEFLTNSVKPKGILEVKWLHGAIAGGLKSDIEMNLSTGNSLFKDFPDYTFSDPSKEFSAEEKMIFEGKLDENGKADITPDIQVYENAPGMLKATFKIRAFEKSGDFSVDRFSIPYSPYRSYVGIKIPEGKGWNGALFSEDKNLFPIVVLDEKGKAVDRKGVKIEIFDVYWRWWWEQSPEDGLAAYVANKSKNLIQTASIDTKSGKALFEMNLSGNHYGRKFIRVTDPISGHSSGQTFYITYKGWGSDNTGDNPGGAEMLTFNTDKEKYQAGEKIKVQIPAAKQGRILVSLESGSRVVNTFWVDLMNNRDSFEIEVTKDMIPNVFIHLTFIQPHSNVKNDLPIRLYGVQSVNIESTDSHIEPNISMPAVIAPEEEFTVSINEKNGRKMTYTLAIVEDGLLDLTRFKTPDPWSYFNAKEALSVKTWDMYNYVIGAFTGKMAGLIAIGGDENQMQEGGAKANRFKPVVKFFGPFIMDAKKTNKHKIKMPNYIGSVRAMVIAGSGSAYGSAEKTAQVKKPLMVLASLPRVIGPGEKVILPVTVFALDKKVKNVKVEVQTNQMFEINDQSSKTISFLREGDQIVNFNLTAVEKTGLANVQIKVSSGTETATYQIELDVRAPNPRITDVIDAMIEPGKSWEGNYKPIGISGTNRGVAELSSIPSLNLESRLQYLLNYPHGCIEQTISAAFPQLFISNLIALNDEQKKITEANIKAAIDKLRSFQIPSGGFSYWPGEQNSANDWGTNYAGHFMLEAQAKGYNIPTGLLADWKKFQKQRADNWQPDDDKYSFEANQLSQAYRLYTLALANDPALGAMNRLRNISNLTVAAKWRLAAAYFLIGKKSVAEHLIANLSTNIAPYRELSYSFGSDARDKAMILETLSMLDRKQDAKIILDELAKEMSSERWHSTQTTAYTLLAAAKFIGNSADANQNISFDYVLNAHKSKQVSTKLPMSQIDLQIKGTESGTLRIKNSGTKTLFVKIQLEGIPATGDQSNAENDLLMKVRYLNLNGIEIKPDMLVQGTDFIAEVQLNHPGLREDYREMALTQIFPSGWEIRNRRMDEMPSQGIINNEKYQDIRDDRVLTYFDLKRGGQKTFKIWLNATYLGDYYLPTVYCEAMYDNQINARKAGQWVKVVAQ